MTNQTNRSTKKEYNAQVEAALDLLLDGFSPASIVRQLAKDKSVSIRQARRYVASAELEFWDSPVTRNELELGVRLQVERLDRIADCAKEAGDIKTEITAAKAACAVRENRLKAIQRSEEFIQKVAAF